MSVDYTLLRGDYTLNIQALSDWDHKSLCAYFNCMQMIVESDPFTYGFIAGLD